MTSGTDWRPSRSVEMWRDYTFPQCNAQPERWSLSKAKRPPGEVGVLGMWESGDDLLSPAGCRLSLAQGRFTVLFGKGRGGTAPLWSPDITDGRSAEGRRTELGLNGSSGKGEEEVLDLNALECIQGYRVKPYGQLVLVSLTHYCASTPSLSTSWSSTTLQGGQASGRSHLQASFTLRCFQRLSLPH